MEKGSIDQIESIEPKKKKKIYIYIYIILPYSGSVLIF